MDLLGLMASAGHSPSFRRGRGADASSEDVFRCELYRSRIATGRTAEIDDCASVHGAKHATVGANTGRFFVTLGVEGILHLNTELEGMIPSEAPHFAETEIHDTVTAETEEVASESMRFFHQSRVWLPFRQDRINFCSS